MLFVILMHCLLLVCNEIISFIIFQKYHSFHMVSICIIPRNTSNQSFKLYSFIYLSMYTKKKSLTISSQMTRTYTLYKMYTYLSVNTFFIQNSKLKISFFI